LSGRRRAPPPFPTRRSSDLLAERGGAADGVAERAVERAGVLRAVGQDAGVDITLDLQRAADLADAAVHHVAGGDNVHAGGRVRQDRKSTRLNSSHVKISYAV